MPLGFVHGLDAGGRDDHNARGLHPGEVLQGELTLGQEIFEEPDGIPTDLLEIRVERLPCSRGCGLGGLDVAGGELEGGGERILDGDPIGGLIGRHADRDENPVAGTPLGG